MAGRPQFLAAILVVESEAILGLTTTQLGDYAAMRFLAHTDPSRLRPDSPTILTVLDPPVGAATPVTLTRWDFAFLRALYESSANLPANGQRSDIGRFVRKELEDQPQTGSN